MIKTTLYLVFITIYVHGKTHHKSTKDNAMQINVNTFKSEDFYKWKSSKSAAVNDTINATVYSKQNSKIYPSVGKTFTSRAHPKGTKSVASHGNKGTLTTLVTSSTVRKFTRGTKGSNNLNFTKFKREDVQKYTFNRQTLSTSEIETSTSRKNKDSISRKDLSFTTPHANTVRNTNVNTNEMVHPKFDSETPPFLTSPLISKITSFVQSKRTVNTNETLKQSTHKSTFSKNSEAILTAIPTQSKTWKTRLITSKTSYQPQKNTVITYQQTIIPHKTASKYTRTRTSLISHASISKKTWTIKEDKKEFTDFHSTLPPKQKQFSKQFKPTLKPVVSSFSPKFDQKTPKGRISHPHSQKNHVHTTLMTHSESSTTSFDFSKSTPSRRIPQTISSQKHIQTKSIPSTVTKAQEYTNHQVIPKTSREQYQGETKILINEIAISQTTPKEQFIELKISSDFTHDLRPYKVVVFSGMGDVLSTIDMHGNTGKQYKILANEDIHVNIRKELQERKSIAVAVYHREKPTSGEISIHSKGVMDAIVLTAYDGKPSGQLMENLMDDNASPFHVSSSALKNGGSISRCTENHVRDTQDFIELSRPKATRGFQNMKCPKNSSPTPSSNSVDNVKMTLAVVMSCLALFLVIVFFVVMMIKHKQRQIKLMQSSLWLKDDDEEEVVLKMGSVTFEESLENPTFNNDVYLTIKS